ncbi:MAG: S-layer homology domain-containing protein, partial [Oscillospiraceae bacterium]|nr:S-layer homology domain-containing protein [Oscillospiraceae bacterium]
SVSSLTASDGYTITPLDESGNEISLSNGTYSGVVQFNLSFSGSDTYYMVYLLYNSSASNTLVPTESNIRYVNQYTPVDGTVSAAVYPSSIEDRGFYYFYISGSSTDLTAVGSFEAGASDYTAVLSMDAETYTAGDAVSVTLSFTGDDFAAWQATITYDPTYLTLTGWAAGAQTTENLQVTEQTAGALQCSDYGGEFKDGDTVLTLTFTAKAVTGDVPTALTAGNIALANGIDVKSYSPADVTSGLTIAKVHTHTYTAAAWTWSADETSASASVTLSCECGDEQVVSAVVTEGSTVLATCTEKGSKIYSATAAYNGQTFTDAYTVTLNATGHQYGEPTFEWAEDYSSCTATFTCAEGDDTQTLDCTVGTKEVDGTMYTFATCTFDGETYTAYAPHAHTFAGRAETISATCTESGSIVVRVYCSVCEETLYTYTVAIPATGHTAGEAVQENVAEATCAAAGSYDVVTYCTVCNEAISSYHVTVPATGHTWDEGTVTLNATRYTTGVKTYTCTVCGATKTETVAKLTGAAASFRFDDVYTKASGNSWYYDAVYWAYDLGVTNGTSDTLFSPTQGCTRAQFATFLYRLAQETGVDVSYSTGNPFSDVSKTTHKDYYDAILWAYENEITNGTSGTTFDPDDTITRAQAVLMLYRYATMVNGGTAPTISSSNPFSDVKNSGADAVYYKAILWAVEQGITDGTSSITFSPGDTCDRAMMVTFLYRYSVGES